MDINESFERKLCCELYFNFIGQGFLEITCGLFFFFFPVFIKVILLYVYLKSVSMVTSGGGFEIL
jgi:hypothetical protein